MSVLLRSALALTLAFLALPRPSAAANYLVHPGDILNIQVYGEQGLPQTTTVLTDGSIVYPLIGHLEVGGETLDTVTTQLTAAFKQYIHDPIVSVAVVTQGPLNVLVLGNVKTPGKYALQPDSRLTDAIAAAGGLGPTNGPFLPARISVGTHDVRSVSLEKLLHQGDVSLNVPLQNDSVVYVDSPTIIRVRVMGAVDKPGEIDVGQGDRLSLAIVKAGDSANSDADLNHIRITRVGPDGKAHTSEVNLYDELSKGNIAADPVLQKDDLVYVPQSRHGSQMRNGGLSVLGTLRSIFLPF